ncbi:hypothetical protein CW745_09865 [Psychromonas sp. psych-6C06]|nr:hypothetical protein CW745_09865 [Psychromonas sp. psych-6C06]
MQPLPYMIILVAYKKFLDMSNNILNLDQKDSPKKRIGLESRGALPDKVCFYKQRFFEGRICRYE